MSASPPGVFRRLIEWAVPGDVGEGIVGDLDELYQQRLATGGKVRAGLWYAGQTVAISGRFGVERVREVASTSLSSVGLDLRLGARMLVKYPMLTLVGGVAITVATAIGVGVSEFVRDMMAPELPLDEGDRIVRVYHLDSEAGGSTAASLYDLEVWRESVSSLEDIGAHATMEQGIISDRGESGTVSLARTTASVFRVTRVPPFLGRYLVETDEQVGAPPVVVLGYDVWQTVLDRDPDPVGRTVQLGGTVATVVGIMPEGYGFPMVQDAWVPLVVDRASLEPSTAPRVALVARLAPGATLESAQAELNVVGRRAAADYPDVYGRLSPAVQGFATRESAGQLALILSGVGLLFVFLLVVACSNVATLVFARTVTREGEIAIRRALGATRKRIVWQLFAEAALLVGGGTALGMFVAWWALRWVSRLFFVVQQVPQPPFWWNDALSPTTLVYGVALAVVGAVMVGVVPALKATSGSVQPSLGRLAAGGGLRFGGIWTVVVVLQVALTVAFLPLAVSQAAIAFEPPPDLQFSPDEYLTAQLGRDPTAPPRTIEERAAFLAESASLFGDLRDRLAADPTVRGAALASGLSAMNHVLTPLEVVGAGAPVAARGRILLVDRGYLDLMNATPVMGRSLGPGDFTPESRSVVLNQAFVDRFLDGRNPVGDQLRFSERGGESSVVTLFPPGASVEIVGVVRNPDVDAFGPGAHAAIYAPLDVAPATPRAAGLVGMPQAPVTQLFVRLDPAAAASAGGLYQTVAALDPSLRLSDVGTVSETWAPVHTGERLGGWIFIAVAAIVLMLSVAGIYALMSFTVSRRSREIAIRRAVGASQGRIVSIIFRRAALQLLAGVVLGAIVAGPALLGGVVNYGPRALMVVSAVLLGAGLTACLLPIRRALSIDPAATMKAQ